VPLAMQLHNTVLHDYISVCCSCIILFDDRFAFAFEEAEIRNKRCSAAADILVGLLKCSALSVNVVSAA